MKKEYQSPRETQWTVIKDATPQDDGGIPPGSVIDPQSFVYTLHIGNFASGTVVEHHGQRFTVKGGTVINEQGEAFGPSTKNRCFLVKIKRGPKEQEERLDQRPARTPPQPYPDEIWLPVPGFEGAYEASDHGRIRSLDRRNSIGAKLKGRILSPAPDPKGYMGVTLSDGREHKYAVHTIIALVFHGPRPTPKHEVNHIDGDKGNNRPENLEYVTSRQNKLHAYSVLGYTHEGEKNPRAVMTEDTARQLRERYQPGQRGQIAQLAREYGLKYQTVYKAITGNSWRTA